MPCCESLGKNDEIKPILVKYDPDIYQDLDSYIKQFSKELCIIERISITLILWDLE